METINSIFTEEPEAELWRNLLQFSYKNNIQSYYDEHSIVYRENIDVLSNSIAGAVLQAYEYYRASKTVSLQVEPLMLYYGTTNLMYAMGLLLTGKLMQINNHGMHISIDDDSNYVADTNVHFNHFVDGAVHRFAANLGFNQKLCDYSPWTLSDFIDSIAEICYDYERCYQGKRSHILLIDVVKTPDGIIEKLFIDEEYILQVFRQVEGFSSAYLSPQRANDNKGHSYLVLRHKMAGKDISHLSYSGQPYLQEAHVKGSKMITIPTELNMYVSLFVLSSLCRYHPERWNPFVTQDSTGEKLLIEKLLYYSRRMLPNIVLNRILGKHITFVSEKYVPDDRIRLVGEHEVREIVEKEVAEQIRKETAKSVIKKRT